MPTPYIHIEDRQCICFFANALSVLNIYISPLKNQLYLILSAARTRSSSCFMAARASH